MSAMRYPIVKAAAHSGASVAVTTADGELPIRSFRDFYAFEQHVKTSRGRRGLAMVPEWYEVPVFYFSNAASLLVDGEDLAAPSYGSWLDYELEVGAVVGRSCRDVDPDDVDDVLLGYTIINDWSLRDVQRQEMQVGLGPAKGKDFATSVGPAVVTPAALAPYRRDKGYALRMTARVDGRLLSDGSWSTLTWSFGEMIARASQGVTLQPGDLIGSGTVGTGCILELGADTVGGWLAPGHTVELSVEQLGTLTTRIV